MWTNANGTVPLSSGLTTFFQRHDDISNRNLDASCFRLSSPGARILDEGAVPKFVGARPGPRVVDDGRE